MPLPKVVIVGAGFGGLSGPAVKPIAMRNVFFASSVTDIPVVASGGAGAYEHMAQVLRETEAAAVAAASMFHFPEQTPREAKLYLKDQEFAVRL